MVRWKLFVVGVGMVALVSCGGGGGSDDTTVTTLQIEDPDLSEVLSSTTTSTSTSTTTTIAVTTTLSPAAIYEQINEEVQRACREAISSGQPAQPEFDETWGSLSSPEELAATVADCVAKTTTTIPGGTPADGGE